MRSRNRWCVCKRALLFLEPLDCERALSLAFATEPWHLQKSHVMCKRVLSFAREPCHVQKSPFTRTCKRALCHVRPFSTQKNSVICSTLQCAKEPCHLQSPSMCKKPLLLALAKELGVMPESSVSRALLFAELLHVPKSPLTSTCRRALCNAHKSVCVTRKRALSLTEPLNVQNSPFTCTCKRAVC